MADKPSNKTTPNAWTLSSDRNPYLHNVFALLQVDPDQGESELLSQCRRLGRRLEAGQHVEAQGRVLVDTDIARAHYLAANAEEFVAERLVTHTVHTLDPREFSSQADAIDAVPMAKPEEIMPLPLRDLSFLTRLLPELPSVEYSDSPPVSRELLTRICLPIPEEEQGYDL